MAFTRLGCVGSALISVLWLTVSLDASLAASARHAARKGSGTLEVSARNPGGAPVAGILIVVHRTDGRTDSLATPTSGLARFLKMPPGQTIVEAHDRDWQGRPRGAYVGHVDTVVVIVGRVIRHVMEVSQRDPPALYR